jgi:DEAD/DEAH box helicase domain-containing protein
VHLDALRLAEAVRERLVDFTADDNLVRDEHLLRICRNLWAGPPDEGGLISDLWVEGAFPAQVAGQSLDDLVRDGVFDPDLCAQLDKPGAVPRHRRLYMHQAEALESARTPGPGGERPAIVVTAGTGAGTTESFLLPILNDLYKSRRNEKGGMRCLILYPMNALVNDQVDRLYA